MALDLGKRLYFKHILPAYEDLSLPFTSTTPATSFQPTCGDLLLCVAHVEKDSL